VCSSDLSGFRRWWYSERLPRFGIDVEVAKGGVECVEKTRDWRPDIVVLETSLLWGGSEGVLAFREADPVLAEIPFVLVAVEGISPLTYRLARYQLQNFLLRSPTIEELVTTVHLVRRGVDRQASQENLFIASKHSPDGRP
jgi:hypothetical protein